MGWIKAVAAGLACPISAKERSRAAVEQIAFAAEEAWSRIVELLNDKASWDPSRLLVVGPAKELQAHVCAWSKIEERSREGLPPAFVRMRMLWGSLADELLRLCEIPQHEMKDNSWKAFRSYMESMKDLDTKIRRREQKA